MDTMLTDGISGQKTEFPAKKPGLMEFIRKGGDAWRILVTFTPLPSSTSTLFSPYHNSRNFPHLHPHATCPVHFPSSLNFFILIMWLDGMIKWY